MPESDPIPPKVPITPPEQWVDAYGNYLYGVALSRLHDPDAARDCLQETFLAGIKAFDRFDGSRDIKFWLRGIMRNKIVDHIRQSVKTQKVSIESEDEALLESFWFKYSGIATTNPAPWQFNPRKYYDNGEFLVVFEDCIRQIKDPARQAFVLRVLEERSTEEICKIMDIAPNYLWVLLHRAREQLKVMIETQWLDKEPPLKCSPANKFPKHSTRKTIVTFRQSDVFFSSFMSSFASSVADLTNKSWKAKICAVAIKKTRSGWKALDRNWSPTIKKHLRSFWPNTAVSWFHTA